MDGQIKINLINNNRIIHMDRNKTQVGTYNSNEKSNKLYHDQQFEILRRGQLLNALIWIIKEYYNMILYS